jgi:hypothetical protein
MTSKAKQRNRNRTRARKPFIAPPEKGYPPQAIQRAEIIRVIAGRLKEFEFDDLVYIGRLTVPPFLQLDLERRPPHPTSKKQVKTVSLFRFRV